MDLFAIGGTLWRHKLVSIPLTLLTLVGVVYVIAMTPTTYQAKADVVLTSPPTPPTAFQIAQDPAMAKVNNPLANLGNLTYVADVLIDVVTAPAAKQALVQEGTSGYQVVLDNASQTNIPPAIDITGTGSNSQSAIQSAQLVATAISRDLNQLQANQHVQSQFMINAVEYVTPTSATKSSFSGRLQTAIGVAAIGLIMLLVAVSIVQGREEQKNRRSRKERVAYRGSGHREPTDGAPELPYGEPRPAMHMGESYPAAPARGPRNDRSGNDSRWGQIG